MRKWPPASVVAVATGRNRPAANPPAPGAPPAAHAPAAGRRRRAPALRSVPSARARRSSTSGCAPPASARCRRWPSPTLRRWRSPGSARAPAPARTARRASVTAPGRPRAAAGDADARPFDGRAGLVHHPAAHGKPFSQRRPRRRRAARQAPASPRRPAADTRRARPRGGSARARGPRARIGRAHPRPPFARPPSVPTAPAGSAAASAASGSVPGADRQVVDLRARAPDAGPGDRRAGTRRRPAPSDGRREEARARSCLRHGLAGRAGLDGHRSPQHEPGARSRSTRKAPGGSGASVKAPAPVVRATTGRGSSPGGSARSSARTSTGAPGTAPSAVTRPTMAAAGASTSRTRGPARPPRPPRRPRDRSAETAPAGLRAQGVDALAQPRDRESAVRARAGAAFGAARLGGQAHGRRRPPARRPADGPGDRAPLALDGEGHVRRRDLDRRAGGHRKSGRFDQQPVGACRRGQRESSVDVGRCAHGARAAGWVASRAKASTAASGTA